MPVESIMVSAVVVSVFMVFAAVLAWASAHAPEARQPVPEMRKRRPF